MSMNFNTLKSPGKSTRKGMWNDVLQTKIHKEKKEQSVLKSNSALLNPQIPPLAK